MLDPTAPRARFQRVIVPRVDRAVKAIELIGNGATRDYETDAAEIAGILARLAKAAGDVEARRHVSINEIVRQIVEAAVDDGLVDAILDDKSGPEG